MRRFLAASQPRLCSLSLAQQAGADFGVEHKIYIEGKVLQIVHILYSKGAINKLHISGQLSLCIRSSCQYKDKRKNSAAWI